MTVSTEPAEAVAATRRAQRQAERQQAPRQTSSSTPTVRAAGRRALFWVLAGAGAVVVAMVASLIAGGSSVGGVPLAAGNPAPAGSQALVEVLRQQGVSVRVVNTLEEATAALSTSADPTLFFADENSYLSSDQLTELLRFPARSVVAAPDFTFLETAAPGLGFGGVSTADTLSAECAVPAALKAGTLSPGGQTLRITDASIAATGCFPSGDGSYSLVELVHDDKTLTLVAQSAVFQNGEIATFGNAALALNLLGESESVVWYLPTLADIPRTGPPSLGALTPGWVTPVLVLLLLTALSAFVWRGRRFGPLVAENLPVTVRANETMEGRARLYARNSARLRAIDALRIGTLSRLATRLGLPRTAHYSEIIVAASALTGQNVADVRAVLVDEVPHHDSDLIRLSDRLTELEALVARMLPGNTPPPTSPTPPTRKN
ncbi:DUF4350 domain-containing protein [Leifsonia sp. YAF41]|uniref:DUF4350 domain-containing protein n=1 Tax=Leifsonia sp. YAF41 TaxID=3233086 RepID=UPI003F9E18F5